MEKRGHEPFQSPVAPVICAKFNQKEKYVSSAPISQRIPTGNIKIKCYARENYEIRKSE